MSVNRKSSIYDLINPCQISETNRAQAFLDSEASSYQGGSGEIRFTLPSSEVMDMTESYIDCLVQLNETDAEQAAIYTLDITGALAGTYRLSYQGKQSADIAIAATAAQIEAALLTIPTISGAGFTVVVAGATPTYTITVSGFDFQLFDNEPLLFQPQFGWDAPLAGIVQTQAGVLSFPRLDYLAPIIRQVRIDINSQQFVTITSANILQNMITLMKSSPDRYGEFYLNDQKLDGFTSANQFRIRIDLSHVDFLKKILPVKYMNKQIRIYLQLEQNDIALQQLSGGGTYSVESPRLHYHRIDLTEQEVANIEGALNGGGLVVPFQNWTTFTDNISVGTGNKNILFNPGVSNLLAVFFVMVPQDYQNTPTNPQKTSVFLRNRIGSYRLKLGSRYFPLDQIDSVNPGNFDMVEPLLELEHAISKIIQVDDVATDRQIYFNYNGGEDGNDPDQTYYNISWNESRRPTFVGGISTADTPHNQWGYICRSDALTGQNVEMLSNVSLEMRDLSLDQDCTLQIYTLHQDFLHITKNNVRWVR